jgi:hypothetical protein
MIQIDTTTVPTELRDEVFEQRLQKQSDFFNSDKFDQRTRAKVCLHEGTHLYYTRECGFEPRLFGPALEYNPRTKQLRETVGEVQFMPQSISMSFDPVLVAKSILAPRFVLEELTAPYRGYIEVLDEADEDLYRRWFAMRSEIKGDVSTRLAVHARDAVYKDCRSPAIRRKLWASAREFEQRVFGNKGFSAVTSPNNVQSRR